MGRYFYQEPLYQYFARQSKALSERKRIKNSCVVRYVKSCPFNNSTKLGNHPSDVLRDLKKFTSKQIIAAIEDKNLPEIRRGWMLWIFRQAGEANVKNTTYQFWQQENHPIELFSNKFIDQKLNYIHQNPVTAGLVDEPWEYRYSSARDYMNNKKGLLDVELI